MNRRQFMHRMGHGSAAIATTSALSSLTIGCGQPDEGKPNIIYILADDLGYGDLGCYGQKKVRTPNLDRMAAEGMRFTDHYAGSTVCAPSRACLMTGFHTGHAWVRGNYETGPHGFGACLELRPEDTTITELLKQAGYTTGVFGKWGLGVAPTTGAPWKKGVDRFYGYLNQGHAHYYYPDFLWDHDEKIELPENADGKRGSYAYDLIVEKALEFIEDNKKNPFFMVLPITIPHAELLVPEDSMAEYDGEFEETPYVGNHYASQPKPHAAFAGMVSRMDRDVGRILTLLKELGIENNTIVLFSSDNGPHLEGGADPDFFDSNGPHRGYKRDLYDGGVRVPMIARWPGKIEAGSISAHLSAFWDVLPTVCDIAGIPSPQHLDGISFLNELTGKSQKGHQYLYWEFHERESSTQAVRAGKWKAVRHSPTGPIELYHIIDDPGETTDVSRSHAGVVKMMESVLRTARTEHALWPLKEKGMPVRI